MKILDEQTRIKVIPQTPENEIILSYVQMKLFASLRRTKLSLPRVHPYSCSPHCLGRSTSELWGFDGLSQRMGPTASNVRRPSFEQEPLHVRRRRSVGIV